MEIAARYLQAIQAIAGTTPGEKYKTLNIIARQIAQAESSVGDTLHADSKILDFPGILMPLIRVEVAKILYRYEGIVEGLKSEDITIVNRALKASWFFDGSDSGLMNAQYFLRNVFPEISLYARVRVVKQLGIHLKNTTIAVELFLALVQRYGINQALPLLVACDEDFVSKIFIEDKLVPSMRVVTAIYRKYPHLIIKYLILNKPVDGSIIVSDSLHILADIARTYPKDFMAIYDAYGGVSNIELNSTETKKVLETHKDRLIEKPGLYLGLLSLKAVTHILSIDEFAKMFKNLFPANRKAFDYNALNVHLNYYKPERDRMSLIIKTFREVYGEDLLSCKDLMNPELVQVLPEADRVHQARLKLADDASWDHDEYIEEPENSWRCYLPTSESIPVMIKEMAANPNVSHRGSLLSQLACTCKINDDKDALLQVLIHGWGYRNDQQFVVFNFLSKVREYFDLALLSAAHWKILDKYIKFLEMKYDSFGGENQSTLLHLIEAALHYRFLNDLPLEDYMTRFLNEILMNIRFRSNISRDDLEFHKKVFDLFVEAMPEKYPSQCEDWNLSSSLVYALWDIVQRRKSSNGKFGKLSIKDYPWLFEKVGNFIRDLISRNDYHALPQILEIIKKWEPDLYYVFLNDVDQFWDLREEMFSDVLRKTPHRVLDNWQVCLEKIQNQSTFMFGRRKRGNISFLITECRWYQDLPIKFFNHALANYKDPGKSVPSLLTLTLLVDGRTFTEIIESLMPRSDQKIIDHDLKAMATNISLLACASNLHIVNPPVSLETIAKFFDDKYLKIAMQSLITVCHRIPVSKIIPFAESLSDRQSTLVTYSIKLTDMVATLEQVYTFLTDLWDKESHTSARLVVFNRIHSLFCKHPNPRSWRMISKCLDRLNINVEDKAFKRLMRISRVPKEYRAEYVKTILDLVKFVEWKSEANPKLHIDVLKKLIKNLNEPISQIIPEEYFQNFMRDYLFDFNYDKDIFEAALELIIENYLLESEVYNELRIQFFGNCFRDSVRDYYDKPHPKLTEFYPMNAIVHKIFAKICSTALCKRDVRIFEALLEIFQSVLRPVQDATSYLELCYSIEYHKSVTSVDFGTRMAEKIPKLIEILSPECVVFMTNGLTDFLKSRTFHSVETSDEKLMSIIEVFANSREIYSGFIAAKILLDNDLDVLNERLETVVHTLRNFHHPGISYALNERAAIFKLP